MRNNEFVIWMTEVKGMPKKSSFDKRSRVKRVEKALSELLGEQIDIDDEYAKNRCENVLNLLQYESVVKYPHNINLPKDKNLLSNLRHSVNKYIEFCAS